MRCDGNLSMAGQMGPSPPDENHQAFTDSVGHFSLATPTGHIRVFFFNPTSHLLSVACTDLDVPVGTVPHVELVSVRAALGGGPANVGFDLMPLNLPITINSVDPAGPAIAAGIAVGDRLITIGGGLVHAVQPSRRFDDHTRAGARWRRTYRKDRCPGTSVRPLESAVQRPQEPLTGPLATSAMVRAGCGRRGVASGRMPGMTYRSLLAMLLAVGCGDNLAPATTPDAAVPRTPDAPSFVEAPFGNAPQLVTVGGATLAHPRIQPIFFANDATMQASIEDFLTQLATSSYWTTTTSEYGVGALTILPTIVTTDAPPTTEDGLTAFIKARFGSTGFPTMADPETIYSLFLPNGTVLSGPDGQSCRSYGAFHDELTGMHEEPIVYALMPRCGQSNQLDSLTVSFSHELIEAATDPRVTSAPAFGDADAEHYVWAFTPGAETGDYCEYVDNGQRIVGNYEVQRSWSNAASRAGHDPCVPAPATPFVAAAPVFPDDLSLTGVYGPRVTKGIAVKQGESKTIDVVVFSDAPTATDLTVGAYDLASAFGGGPAQLTFALDKTTAHNGDTLKLTITRTANGNDIGDGSEFVLAVNDASMRPISLWWGFAGNDMPAMQLRAKAHRTGPHRMAIRSPRSW